MVKVGSLHHLSSAGLLDIRGACHALLLLHEAWSRPCRAAGASRLMQLQVLPEQLHEGWQLLLSPPGSMLRLLLAWLSLGHGLLLHGRRGHR